MANLTNEAVLADLRNNNKAEYFKSSKIIFECFDYFSQKSEQIGNFKTDQWAQIQTVDGRNAITILLVWTHYLNVSFLIFNNFVFLISVSDWIISDKVRKLWKE